MLGCSEEKGNLLYDISDKMAFSFYDKKSGRSVKLTLMERDPELPDEEWLNMLIEKKCDELFKEHFRQYLLMSICNAPACKSDTATVTYKIYMWVLFCAYIKISK